jgi:hypothetical protein
MQTITNAAELQKAIQLLQEEEVVKRKLLQEEFRNTVESFRPINLLKKAVKDVSASSELMDNIIGHVAGLASGYLSNKIFVGKSGNLLKKIIGVILQLGISKVVSQHPDAVRSLGRFVIDFFLRKKETDSEDMAVK